MVRSAVSPFEDGPQDRRKSPAVHGYTTFLSYDGISGAREGVGSHAPVMARKPHRGVLVAAIAIAVVSSALVAGLGGATAAGPYRAQAIARVAPSSSPAPPPPLSNPSSAASLITARAESLLHADGLPSAEKLVPNVRYTAVREGGALVPANLVDGQVSPGPTSIGVNDLGFRVNSTGGFVPYSYRTTSIDGTVTINNLTLLPIMSNASDAITVQLNAILNNVTLFGQSVNQIWAQNVIFYSVAGNQLQLLTDGWNFTGPPFQLFANDIYENSPGGDLFTGVYVHQVPLKPPAFIVHPPFTIRLYLNATNIDGRNALFFNYTLASARDITLGGVDLGRSIQHGSFDWIIFNSTAGMPSGYAAPPASFLISGSQPSGLGLPNDAEIAICGPSDGFSADIRSMDAVAQLLYLNGTTGRYSAVPAAFTTTEDTGESVEGVDVHFTAASALSGTAYLTNGPEFVYGLWNASASGVTEQKFTVDVSPASTLLWVSPDLGGPNAGFNNSSAAWALSPLTDISFWLPTGSGETYSIAGLANDFGPRYSAIAPGMSHLSLSRDAAMGVYVPILAFGNAGVAAIAKSGDGSFGDPYIISYSQHQPISSLFGTYDGFTEPLYPGLLLADVTAHVVIQDPPNLRILYTRAEIAPLEYFGLSVPLGNYLPMEVYDSSNISIVGAQEITGWFPISLSGFLMGSLYLSDDAHMLVANNQFSSMGSAMVIVDPYGNRTNEDNTVFGNTFATNGIVSGPFGGDFYLVVPFNTTYAYGPAVGGLGVFSSGNLIYNNFFATPIEAYSPPQNPYLAYVFINDLGYHDYSSVNVTWHNSWNIPLSPVWAVHFVNGFPLKGSIVGAPFQGGNAWVGWFTGYPLPYDDYGLIFGGGDQVPVPIPGLGFYAVVFHEHGLPAGARWSVTIGGAKYSSTGSMILVYVFSLPYTYSIANSHGESPHPSSGTLDIMGNAQVWTTFT
jgi:thermopsin